MKVEHIHTIDHTPGFKGSLHRFTGAIEPHAQQYLSTNLPVITRGLAKANSDGLKVADVFSDRIAELLKAFGIETRQYQVPDDVLMLESVGNLLDRYIYA